MQPAKGVAVVLIGTGRTLEWLAEQLQTLDRGVIVRGGVVIGDAETELPDLGGLDGLPQAAARYGVRTAVVSLPAEMRGERERVSAAVRVAGMVERWVPWVGDWVNGGGADGVRQAGGTSAPLRAAPSIDMAALVGRTPYSIDRAAVAPVLEGKRVLITGAGGSIGSELARVAASFRPSMLVLMERSENALFEIDRQMARHFPGVPRKAVLHDVVDSEGTLRLCGELRPQAVFHAAAHKHVPLMEDHPSHAITNNLFGTKSIADASVACGAERFVMISSDKAVNPTSVMGATKRLAEVYVRGLGGGSKLKAQSSNEGTRTRLSMVRFGNVLGSACSVLTIWSTQLAEGGPITVTDPRMTRYFMTIPEAATLVVASTGVGEVGGGIRGSRDRGIEAGTTDGVGVYVLDMGEPVRILDLACRFVRAHGMTPRVRFETAGTELGGVNPAAYRAGGAAETGPEMDVVFTGTRPGEKLHEELAYAAELLRPTAHPGVRAWAGPGFGEADAAAVEGMVAELASVRLSRNPEAVLAAIRRHVPEMRRGDATRA